MWINEAEVLDILDQRCWLSPREMLHQLHIAGKIQQYGIRGYFANRILQRRLRALAAASCVTSRQQEPNFSGCEIQQEYKLTDRGAATRNTYQAAAREAAVS